MRSLLDRKCRYDPSFHQRVVLSIERKGGPIGEGVHRGFLSEKLGSLTFCVVDRHRMALCARFTNDIHVDVRRVPFEKLATLDVGESLAVIRTRVDAAREVQAAR